MKVDIKCGQLFQIEKSSPQQYPAQFDDAKYPTCSIFIAVLAIKFCFRIFLQEQVYFTLETLHVPLPILPAFCLLSSCPGDTLS